MADALTDTFPLAKRPVESLPATDQVDFVKKAVAEHMQTVEERIQISNLSGIGANVARFEAVSDLHRQVGDVWRVMGWKALMGTGFQSNDLVKAAGKGLDTATDFLTNIRTALQFSPDRPSKIELEDMNQAMSDEMLRIAFRTAEQVLDRFPGLQKVMKEHANYPEEEWQEYVKEKGLKRKAKKMPEGLEMVMEFIRYVWKWEELDKTMVHPDNWVRNPYNDAHLKKFPAMTDIKYHFLTEKEQNAVEQVTNYGGGPDFIKRSTLI